MRFVRAARYTVGDYFGEDTVLSPNRMHEASLVANADDGLGCLFVTLRISLPEILSKMPPRRSLAEVI